MNRRDVIRLAAGVSAIAAARGSVAGEEKAALLPDLKGIRIARLKL